MPEQTYLSVTKEVPPPVQILSIEQRGCNHCRPRHEVPLLFLHNHRSGLQCHHSHQLSHVLTGAGSSKTFAGRILAALYSSETIVVKKFSGFGILLQAGRGAIQDSLLAVALMLVDQCFRFCTKIRHFTGFLSRPLFSPLYLQIRVGCPSPAFLLTGLKKFAIITSFWQTKA